MPANANIGLSSFNANHTTSFFLVSGFGSGAYSAKLLAGTRQRFSGLSDIRHGGALVLLRGVFAEGFGREEAAVLRLERHAPVRRRGVANVRDRRPACARRRGH